MKQKQWQNHYNRDKSRLFYPDENLVRMLAGLIRERPDIVSGVTVDLGCGSGRHLKLLQDFDFNMIAGMDISTKGLAHASAITDVPLAAADIRDIPLKNNSVDIIIAWGSLHYCHKDDLQVMLREIYRVMKHGAVLLATIRNTRDTYLKRGNHLGSDIWQTSLKDIAGSTVSFFNEAEIKHFFSLFDSCVYGTIERTIPGDMSSLISHWVIRADKQ